MTCDYVFPCLSQQIDVQMPVGVTSDVLEILKLPMTQKQTSLTDTATLAERPLSDCFSLKR